jgi:phosphate transport system substrate-binding protein
MINKGGKVIAPKMESFQAAATNADWKSAPGYGLMLADQPGEGSWPITAASFIDANRCARRSGLGEALDFFDWADRSGDELAEALDYVPMPDNVVGLVQDEWVTQFRDELTCQGTDEPAKFSVNSPLGWR